MTRFPMILLLAGSLSAAVPANIRADDRPNIILCMTDDQGWGDVSYNGLKQIQTPALDSMARGGLRFDRFYAQQSCSPTRACVMTGRHPNRMGVFWPGMPLRRQEQTIAQAAKLAGYATGHFGKWHLNGVSGPGKPISASDPLGPDPFGFDEWFSVTNFFDLDWTFSRKGTLVTVKGDGSDAIVAEALKFIGEMARQKKPFLALVWYGNPHAPHKPLPEDLKAAGGSAYFGEIVAIDRSMGKLRAGLRNLGIADNTLVVFSSDNGGWVDPKKPEANGVTGGLRGRKGDMWEGGIRVPGIMEWPARIKRPFATDMPAGLIDIYPTIVELLGVKVPNQVEPLDGVSLVPLIDGKMKQRPRPMGFWQYDESQPEFCTDSGPAAWSDNRFKLVKTKTGKWELYDIPADLAEKKDVAAQHPEVVARMKAELEAWQQSVVRSYRGEDYPEKRVIQPEQPEGTKRAKTPRKAKAPKASAAEPPAAYDPVPSPRQLAWHEMEFYGFLHFTVNTFTDQEWGFGSEKPAVFNPTAFDADQIVGTAKEAGMKGLILTCKHHDGFCLWPSKFTEHSVKNSPWKNGRGDVVREVSDACRKHGLKFGVYLSPWDRNHKDYGRPEYLTYYRNQLRELLTGYGPIFEVWFDGANGGTGYYGGAGGRRRIDPRTYYDWPATTKIVRELQPDACMFSDAGPDVRWVGNESGRAGDPCWATLNRDNYAPGVADARRLNSGERPGTHWLPAECDVSIRPGWFYHAKEDGRVRTPQNLVDLYFVSVGRGGSLLLNLPPDRRGRIHENDVKSLEGFRRLLDATFAKDLATGAAAMATNVRGQDRRFAAANVLDGKRDTYWATDDGVTTAELVLDLGKPVTFNIVRLREYLPLGQRVEAFALDQWKDGRWIEFAAATSIGSCRLVRGQPITTEKVRLRIVKSPVPPAIAEMGLFLENK